MVATAALGLRRGFAGHGAVIADTSALARRRVQGLDQRARDVLANVSYEPTTAWELLTARGHWRSRSGGAHPVAMPFLALGQLLGLLDLLLARGVLEELDDGRLVRYRQPSAR